MPEEVRKQSNEKADKAKFKRKEVLQLFIKKGPYGLNKYTTKQEIAKQYGLLPVKLHHCQ